MSILSKLSDRVFTAKTVSYKAILAIDSIIVWISTLFAFFLLDRNALITDTVEVLIGTVIIVAVYVICFIVFHTFRGVIRYSSFVDLQRIVVGTTAGALSSYVVAEVLAYSGLLPDSFLGSVGALVTWGLVTLLMWQLRVLVRFVHDQYRKSDTTKSAFIYGAKSGGASLAAAISSEVPLRYTIRGFINPEANDTDWLHSIRVYPEENMVSRMKAAGATALFVSPQQTAVFSQKKELINGLLAAGIKIMMVSREVEWDGKSDISAVNSGNGLVTEIKTP